VTLESVPEPEPVLVPEVAVPELASVALESVLEPVLVPEAPVVRLPRLQ